MRGRHRSPARLWCDANGFTLARSKKYGGAERLAELKVNQPEIFRILTGEKEEASDGVSSEGAWASWQEATDA